jgi:hypothetical protein
MIRRLAALTVAQQVLLALLVAALVGALGVTLPRLGNAAMLAASASLVAALAVLGQWLWQHQHTTDWSNTFMDASPPRGGDVRISRLSETVHAAGTGDPKALRQLHDLLSALATERLRDRRGISASQPDTAQAALGADLSAYLAGPPSGPLAADRLERLISTLEEL